MVVIAARVAAHCRRTSVHVFVLRVFHRLRIVLHTESFHRRHYRQLQHAEEKGRITLSLAQPA